MTHAAQRGRWEPSEALHLLCSVLRCSGMGRVLKEASIMAMQTRKAPSQDPESGCRAAGLDA
jgi:hypothetical protein